MPTNRGPHDRSDSDHVSEKIEESSKEADTVIIVNDNEGKIEIETSQHIEEKEDGE